MMAISKVVGATCARIVFYVAACQVAFAVYAEYFA